MLTELGSSIPYEVIKDPIYGYIRLYEHEGRIVNTPSFQRLRRIKQLYSGQFVYPGATHTRFSHSLGVMHLSGLFISQILEPYSTDIPKDTFLHYFFLMRLWGLTHDLGHGPFSHIFDQAVLEKQGINHEYMSSKIVQEDDGIADIIGTTLGRFSITPKTLSEYLGKSTREEWTSAGNIGNTNHSEMALYYVLKGFYSVDIIDYLLRDNYNTGAGYGSFDWQRLILHSHLHKNEIALDKKARDALDALLLSRVFSFNTIYYHRWSRAVDHLTRDFLEKADKKIDFRNYTQDAEKYSILDEESIFHMKEIKRIPEREMLLKRQIPFREIDEVKWGLPVEIPLTADDIERKMSQRLGSKVPFGAYFVDTPNLPLNPMLGERQVCILDKSESPPVESYVSIRDTSWGEMADFAWNVRLYLNLNHKASETEIKSAFDAVVKGGKRDSFY